MNAVCNLTMVQSAVLLVLSCLALVVMVLPLMCMRSERFTAKLVRFFTGPL